MASVQLLSLICQLFQIVVIAQTAFYCVFPSTNFGTNTNFCLRHTFPTDTVFHPSSFIMITGGSCLWDKGRLKLTNHFHLVPKVRKGGARPPRLRMFLALCLIKHIVNVTCTSPAPSSLPYIIFLFFVEEYMPFIYRR